jgi:IS30 family transposase
VTIANVHDAFLRIRTRFPELKTLTMDNDILFAKHETLRHLLRVRIYFCHPYHSWEKGSVENANRVIRRDLPKGSDISQYVKGFFRRIEAKLNRRPMRVLKYATPHEVLERYRAHVQRNKKRP